MKRRKWGRRGKKKRKRRERSRSASAASSLSQGWTVEAAVGRFM